MKKAIPQSAFLVSLLLILSVLNNFKAFAQLPETKEPELPSLTYGAKINLVNFTYNPIFFPDNTFIVNYPSAVFLVKDFKDNTHEIELATFSINRYSKDAYINDISVLYQYDVILTKAKDLKLLPLLTPYVSAGFSSIGGSDSTRGKYYSNEFYARLGIGLGLRYNFTEKTFIDVIPTIKLTHFYWLSGRMASIPTPTNFSNNQLLEFELRDIFFKVGIGHWF